VASVDLATNKSKRDHLRVASAVRSILLSELGMYAFISNLKTTTVTEVEPVGSQFPVQTEPPTDPKKESTRLISHSVALACPTLSHRRELRW
jgi:hypothetical protein